MKTQQEIEQLAFLKYPRVINDPYNPMEDDNTYERKIWIGAYTQCQEDMADKKYTEEDLRKAFKYGIEMEAGIESFDYKNYPDGFSQFIDSLNKQD